MIDIRQPSHRLHHLLLENHPALPLDSNDQLKENQRRVHLQSNNNMAGFWTGFVLGALGGAYAAQNYQVHIIHHA
jgi:hypothetical protein